MRQLNFNQFLDNPDFVPATSGDWDFLRALADNIFKPRTPIDDDRLFAGRTNEINQLLEAVYSDGGHAIIFGERGVGKTSLAKIIKNKIAPVIPNLSVIGPVSCGVSDDFYTVWGNAFNEFNANGKTPVEHFRAKNNPYEIYNAINDLPQNQHNLFIFDEFDRVKEDKTKQLMADLLKHYSNNPVNSTIVVVGVGDTLLDLFASHASIARCCEQIRMPRMTEQELNEILDERLPKIRCTAEENVRSRIIHLSQGLPGYVHLLGQLALRSAIDRRSTNIEDEDFDSALENVLARTDYETRDGYYKAISSAAKDNKYKEVLLACALAKANEMGYFFAGSLREPYSRIRGREMDIPNYATNLNNLCLEERGPALVKSGKPKRFQYRFANPLLQPLTIMMGLKDGMIKL